MLLLDLKKSRREEAWSVCRHCAGLGAWVSILNGNCLGRGSLLQNTKSCVRVAVGNWGGGSGTEAISSNQMLLTISYFGVELWYTHIHVMCREKRRGKNQLRSLCSHLTQIYSVSTYLISLTNEKQKENKTNKRTNFYNNPEFYEKFLKITRGY